MGVAGSVQSLNVSMALDASDVDTPRGVSAKEEVKRLRNFIVQNTLDSINMLARAKFKELDVDNSGYLENAEVLAVVDWCLQSFSSKLGSTTEEVRTKLMSRIDANKDGKLDFEEFEVLFKEMLNRMMLLERARAKFNEFDVNKNGMIENDELRQVIMWTLDMYPADDVATYGDHLIASIDADKDGGIDLREFTDLFEMMLVRMDLIERAKQKFQELDVDKSGKLEREEIDSLVTWVLSFYSEKTEEQRSHYKSALMTRVDVNKDGIIDLQEFATLFEDVLYRYGAHISLLVLLNFLVNASRLGLFDDGCVLVLGWISSTEHGQCSQSWM